MPASTPRLDPASHVPLHAQAEKLLRDMIRRREYRVGALIPDELTLANQLGVSRGTLRAAIARLVTEGLLERRAGVGTRVTRPKTESGITAWRSFSREMAAKGIQVENYSLNFTEVDANDAAAKVLEVPRGSKLWRLDRVRGWGAQPVLHSRSWFHPRLRMSAQQDFSLPLYETIAKETGIVAEQAFEEFKAVAANVAMADLLQIEKGEPLLLRRHVVFDRSSRPIEFAEVHYVSSRFTLTLDLRREDAGIGT
jgi:GntR family transcriptional regulator